MEGKSANVRYYSPAVRVEKPPSIPKAAVAYPSKLPDVVKVRLKASAVAEQIAVALYKSPSAGFREIYSNECRAARIARNRYGANPRIEVTLDPKERRLTVHGIDSLGIASEVFVEVLRYMGRTTNNQAGEVGQFGWGFFAVFTLTDDLRLETYARETNERYGVTAQSAAGFKPLPDEEVEIAEYGTKITLKVKQQIGLIDLVGWIERYCRFSDIETNLTITDDVKDERWGWVRREAGRSRLDGSFKDQLRKSVEDDLVKVVYEVELDRPDYYFYGAIAGDEEGARTESHGRAHLLLLQVPIWSDDLEEFDPPLTGWVLNIKDERRYPPTPDRDRFKEGAIKTVLEEIQNILQTKFAEDFKLRSLDDYRRQRWRGIYASTESGAAEIFDQKTRAFASLLNTNIVRPRMEDEAHEDERVYGHRSTSAGRAIVVEPLRKVVLRTDKIFYYPLSFTPKGAPIIPAKRMALARRILRTKFDRAEVIAFDYSEWRYAVEGHIRHSAAKFKAALSRTGINMDAKAEAAKIREALGKAWRSKCGLPEVGKKPPPIDWPIHKWSSRGRVEAERVNIKRIPADIIRVPGKVEPFIKALQRAETKYGVTRDHPALRGGTKLKDLLTSFKNKEAMTECGKMTFEKIAAQTEELLIYLTDNAEILKHYAPEGQFVIAAEGDQAVQLMFYLEALNKTYVTTRAPSDEAFRSKTGIHANANYANVDLVDRHCIYGGKLATIAFIGSCQLSTPELKEMMLTAIEEAYDPDEAESFRKLALDLEESMRTHRDQSTNPPR